MTDDRKRKRLIRERMRETGESYTVAAKKIDNERNGEEEKNARRE